MDVKSTEHKSPGWAGPKHQMQPPRSHLALLSLHVLVTTNHLLSETTSKLLHFQIAVFLKTWFHQTKTQKGTPLGVILYLLFTLIQKNESGFDKPIL